MRNFLNILLLILFSFMSCNDETVRVVHFKYFDLADFLRKEAKTLAGNNMKLEKEIIKDSIREKKNFDNVDWQKELRPFIECDINKPAWLNAYKIDTAVNNDVMIIVYSAVEEQLPVKTIELKLNKNKITDILIHKVRNNFYYQSEDFLSYHVMQGFEISGSQNVRLLDKTLYQINAIYIR